MNGEENPSLLRRNVGVLPLTKPARPSEAGGGELRSVEVEIDVFKRLDGVAGGDVVLVV